MLRIGSLFSGIGGLELGLEMCGGFETVWQAENNLYASFVLAKHWPNARRYDDVRSIDRSAAPIDVLAGGFPCFRAGTLILTEEGYRPIETLKVGDRVLSHLGNWKPITALMVKENAPIWEVESNGALVLSTTEEHPFYVRKRQSVWDNSKRANVRTFTAAEWLEAGQLTKAHFAAQVLPAEVPSDLSPAFLWLVGRYLADGWRVRRLDRAEGGGRVTICCAHHEASALADGIVDAGFTGSPVVDRTVVKFHITNSEFYRFLEQFGHLAHGKTLPGWVFSLPQVSAEALLSGYLSGDGSYDAKRADWSCTTVSQQLALGIALLAQRARGVVAGVRRSVMKPKKIIEGREVNQRDFFSVRIPPRNRSAFVEGQYGWKRIRSAKRTEERSTVYNIAVEGDESYVANGAVVHNCQPHSLAGKRGNSTDERDLWEEFARIIGETRPRWVVAENVPGLLSSRDEGFGRDHKGAFFGRVLRSLAERGYNAEWRRFGAFSVGAHHRRERVFLVAYPDSTRLEEREGFGSQPQQEQPSPERSGFPTWAGGDWEQPAPLTERETLGGFRGVADRISGRSHRIERLGNAIVCQQAQVIGEAILDAEKSLKENGCLPEQIIREKHIQKVLFSYEVRRNERN